MIYQENIIIFTIDIFKLAIIYSMQLSNYFI